MVDRIIIDTYISIFDFQIIIVCRLKIKIYAVKTTLKSSVYRAISRRD